MSKNGNDKDTPLWKVYSSMSFLLIFLVGLPNPCGSRKLRDIKDTRPFRFWEIGLTEDAKWGMPQDSEANPLGCVLLTGVVDTGDQ